MLKKHRLFSLTALISVGVLLTAACSSSKKATTTTATTAAGGPAATTAGGTTAACGDPAKNTASAPGITKDTVTIGIITSVTGAAGSSFSDAPDGANARIQAQNAAGGVCGRKINLVTADDASTLPGDLTASQSVVESKGAFAVIDYSPYAFGGIRYLQGAGIPVIGSGFDGPEWHQEPYTNMFSWSAQDPTREGYTHLGLFFKKLGATTIAGLAYADSPSSINSIKGMKASVEAAGLKMPYVNLTVPFGGVNFGAYALDMKKAGIDGAACSCVDSSNFAMFTALKQAGLTNAKGLAFSGPSNGAFDNAATAAAAEGEWFSMQQTPIIAGDSNIVAANLVTAVNEYKANLMKYVPTYKGGFPTYGQSGSYMSADLIIQGLIDAGQNPTRTSYMNAIRSTEHAYDAHGLLASPVDFSLAAFPNEAATSCDYFVTITNGKYVLPFDKICGPKITG